MGTVDLRDADAACGAKAWRLGMLLRAGLPVPPGVVVLPSASDAQAAGSAVGGALLDRPVAVRSSGLVEDGDVSSFAGQLESVLGAVGAEAVAEAVERCATSGRSARAAAYAERVGSALPQRVPVIVQQLVDAEVSGVLFTRDPRTGAATVVIEASWGLGPSVVDGEVVPDVVTVDIDGVVSTTVGAKHTRVDRTGAGVTTTAVAEVDRARPCLWNADTHRLATLGRAAETVVGRPVDVEWAIAGGEAWLLQVRPITTGSAPSSTPPPDHGATALLRATGASPGTATGPARVVRDVDGFPAVRRGDVLVCRTTDPSWTPLFGIVSAVVTESGGILSHAAIVAREVGIPAVVGAAGALDVLPGASLVVVDGSRGTVLAAHPDRSEDTP